MHMNPICHWAGGLPLFTWAPGDDKEVDTTRSSLPNARVFYDTSAALVAAGVPAPTHLHPCQEAAGAVSIADVTGNGADLVPTGNVLSGCRTPPLWDPVAKNFYGHYRRALEAEYFVQTAGFVCGNAALGDPGAGSMAGLVFIRTFDNSGTAQQVLSKRVLSGSGWILSFNGGTSRLEVESTAGVNRNCSTAANSNLWNSPVTALFYYIDRTLQTMRVWSSSAGWGALLDISALGIVAISSAQPLTLFGGTGASVDIRSMAGHVLWNGLWYGAAAEALAAGWDATYKAILSPVWAQPLGVSGQNDSPGHDLCNYDGYVTVGWSQAVVGDDPAFGLVVGDFCRSGAGFSQYTYPWRYDPLISRTSKIVAAQQSTNNVVNSIDRSDQIDDATWTKSNVTVSLAWADMVESPAGLRTARRLTATANAGYVSDTIATTVGRVRTIDLMYRRGTAMVGDVAGRLVAYNITGGAEIASTPFTATAKWQRTFLEWTAPAVSSAMRIEITNNGDVIHVARCCSYEYGFQECPIQHGADNPNMANGTTQYKVMPSAAEALNPDSGEVEIRCRRFNNVAAPSNQFLFDAKTTQDTASNSFNRRQIYIDTSNQIVARVWNSAGVLVATMTSAPIDMRTETLIRLRWAQGGLPSGNTIELIINVAVPISGVVIGWASSLTVATYSFTCSASNDSGTWFGGSINYIKVWGAPRP